MNLEVLISTMNLKDENENLKLIKRMNIKTKSLTINQITNKEIQNFEKREGQNEVISKKEKGLSKSRNLAVQEAKAEICIFADNDIVYENNYEKIIKEAYNKYKDTDIICFWIESNNSTRKIKKMCTSKIGKLRVMRICSLQITFKRKRIIENNIKFDENFGAGIHYDRGEETIFLKECIDKGLKIRFVNKKIANVNQQQSVWFNGYNKTFFKKQGAVFYRISNRFYKLLIFQYAIRKYKLYRKKVKMIDTIKYMNIGVKEYGKRLNKYNNTSI